MSTFDAKDVSVLAVDGSPSGGGKTHGALAAVLFGAAASGASVTTVGIGGGDVGAAVEALSAADAIVLGTPVYRASFAAPLKSFLDAVPRSSDERRESPLAGKAIAIVYTGASLHHFLAPDSLRSVLAGFFAAHVVPPGLYIPREGFAEDNSPVDPYREQARLQGTALVELAVALHGSVVLRSLRPHA